jgi:mRNA interferase MazF
MVPSAAGAVVLIKFPFSDLSSAKFRPAVVIADCRNGDWLLCQITSNAYADPAAVQLDSSDFSFGSLHLQSFARPGKLFTAHRQLFQSELGILTPAARTRVVAGIVQIVQAGTC